MASHCIVLRTVPHITHHTSYCMYAYIPLLFPSINVAIFFIICRRIRIKLFVLRSIAYPKVVTK